jgi:hypothetical protein
LDGDLRCIGEKSSRNVPRDFAVAAHVAEQNMGEEEIMFVSTMMYSIEPLRKLAINLGCAGTQLLR